MANESTELTYAEIVNDFARRKVDAEISNSKLPHAEAIMSTMVIYAKREVNIFCGTLDGDLYEQPEFISRAVVSMIMHNKVRFRAVVQHLDAEALKENGFYKIVMEMDDIRDRCEFYTLNEGSTFKEDVEHFATMDDAAYRLETDTDSIKAIANFNDPGKTTELKNRFEQIISDSTPVPFLG